MRRAYRPNHLRETIAKEQWRLKQEAKELKILNDENEKNNRRPN